MFLALALLLVACGGAGPRGPAWPGGGGPVVVPLVDAWRPERPLVEVTLDGHGPYLFVLATGMAETAIVAPVARDLGLRARPDRDPLHARVDRLEAGGLVLTGLRCRILPTPEALGAFHERPVVGALGADVLRGTRFDVDPGAGVVRFHPPDADPPVPPAGARALPLERRGAGFTVPARVGDEDVDLWLATESPLSRLREGVVDAGGGAVPHGDVLLAEGPPRRVLVLPLPGAPADVDGVLGGDLLRGAALRFDPRAGRLLLWTPTGAGRLRRFPDVDLTGLRARLLRAEGQRVEVAFDAPARRIPPRYWVRVDAGLPGAPRPLLVRLQPRGAGPLRAVLEHHDLAPDRLRPEGAALDVLDVVPLDTPCQGDVCLVY